MYGNSVNRRFPMHVLPNGFHRIRHYGLLANGSRADNLAKARALLNVPKPDTIPDDPKSSDAAELPTLSRPCSCCGGRMLIIETFARGCEPKYRPAAARLVIRILRLSPSGPSHSNRAYSLFSLTRAFAVVNCQSALA
ncbi:MAG: transposase [Methylocystis sp.]|nr:transposase [Methylocystis sp.]